MMAAEKRIAKDRLPRAVQKTAEEQSKGAVVRGYSKDIENGKLEYEVQLQINGHSKDVTIAPGGSVLEIEEQVGIDSLPSQVRAALEAKAKTGKITKIESLTKRGAIVAYEAQVITAGKRSELQVGPQGQTLDHEE
jgi:hypothetical protein